MPNLLLKFKSKKNIDLSVENQENIVFDNSTKKIIQYSDFFFIIKNKTVEYDKIYSTQKNLYTGYISILDVTVNNGTDNMTIIYDKELNKIIKSNGTINNLRHLNNESEPDMSYVGETGKLCFIKIEFYESGEVKNIYLPDSFIVSNMIYLDNIIKLIIPKISPNLYIKNINDEILNILNGNEEEYNETEYNETDIDSNNLRLLSNESLDNLTEGDSEQYLSTPLSDSIKVNLREISHFENVSLNTSNNIIVNNYFNITEYSIQELESEQISFKESQINTIIYTIIDEIGNIIAIQEKQNTYLNQNNNEGSDDEEADNLKAQVYNEDNLISHEDASFEEDDNNDFKFNISTFSIETVNNIFSSDNVNNENLNKQLFEYFDSFGYKIYNKSENNETYLRFLEYKEQIIKDNNLDEHSVEFLTKEDLNKLKTNMIRNLYENQYNGIKKVSYEKDLYNNNILGLKTDGLTFLETDLSTGITTNYYIMAFGNINSKINLSKKQTNTHIIIEKTNQMIFKLISLLYQSNKDLVERNKMYSDIIIDLESKTTELFEEIFDFSGLFRSTLNNMYEQVKNFTGDFFKELIVLINNVHKNYTKILNNVKINKYEEINQIRIVTKKEYINYINNMIDILSNFENQTLIFLDDIAKELQYIFSFQIDILYDIIDAIYDCKLIFKEFNRNLFKAIEKGIITFKYDIKDYIEEIIGDLLYTTDFLSVNINKNEILKQAFDEQTRKDITAKLRDFRDIILTIMDILINNIYSDYDNEMSMNNKNSIKYYSESKALYFLNEIEDKSNDIIRNIKQKIMFIDLYENYSSNLDEINRINNKTLSEFNGDIYNKIILKLSEIQPNYLNESNNIIINKNNLFEISKNLSKLINQEIDQINNQIELYSKKYFEENLYNFHYNLYYFRKYFLNDEMEKLLNDFKKLINDTILIDYKKLIDNNYQLAIQVLYEEESLTTYGKKNYICSGFIERYYLYKSYFQEFMYLSFSDDFMDLVEQYFFQIRDDILNYVNNKILSINEYYFNDEIYVENFYFIHQINDEIYKIIDNINNYYNEIILNEIQIQAVNLSMEELKEYNNKKEKELDKKYEYVESLTRGERGCNEDYKYKTKRKARKVWRTTTHYLNCRHQSNIKKVLRNLSETNIYMKDNTNFIIKNFINKFDKYLSNYVKYSQSLYSTLYNYYENKINDHSNIEKFLFNYKNILLDIMENETNNKLYEEFKIKEKKYISKISEYIVDNFQNNIEKIKETYFFSYYLQDYKNFLEYPEEIKYKIDQFLEELKNNTNLIKDKINLLYKNKILSVIKETNIFIENMNKFNLNYIISHINIFSIIEKYFKSKCNILNEIFYSFNQDIRKESDCFYQEKGKKNSYNFADNINLNTSLDNYLNFSEYFKEVIEQNFTIINCTNISLNSDDLSENENVTYQTVCWTEKYKSELNYSEYNFNIVKLRTGIYYTKTLSENIDKLFDNLDFNNLMNEQKIKMIDDSINDKNILNIYNSSLFKLNEINRESKLLLSEPLEYFLEDFQNIYTFQYDFLPFYDDIKKILKYEHEDYIRNVTIKNNNTLNKIYLILEDFNQTLFKQISLIKKYDFYNINKNYFKSSYFNYSLLIQKGFNIYKEKILNLDKNHLFYNSLKNILRSLQLNKRNTYKNIINDFSNNYDFELLNISYNLGEDIYLYLLKEYDNYEFTFIYDYFELFDKNTEIYIKNITKLILEQEKLIQEKLKNIYNNFSYNFEMNISDFVNYKYINDLELNYSKCINYSYDKLNEIIKEDEINYKNYMEYLDLINSLNNCSNEGNISCINISDIEPVIYFNKTEHLLECYNNNYYNYTVFIFEQFNESYKNSLDNMIKNITNEIENNYIDENFLIDYLKKYYHFEEINESMSDFYRHYEDFEDLIFYINYKKDEEYKNSLFNSLIDSFNISYSDLVKNYIINEMIDNITIFINSKLDIHIEFLQNKILKEYYYYLLLLNNTKEIGITSKKALIDLYLKLKQKLNESLLYLIENDIYFYIDLYFRENKNNFKNNFINYYSNKNEYKIEIHKLGNFYDDIIYDKMFNKTLDNITSDLMKKIQNEMKESIKKLINNKLMILYDIIDNIQVKTSKKLDNITIIEISDDMSNINNLIINYSILVDNQNNRYTFNVGREPFNYLKNFIKNNLEPPLLSIKSFYNSIEERLLEEIIKIVENFPDFYTIIKYNLHMESRIANSSYFFNEINSTLFEYKDILNEEISGYFNNLTKYTYINGLNTYEYQCNDSFCYSYKKNETNGSLMNDNDYNIDDDDDDDLNIMFTEYNSLSMKELKSQINKNINLENKNNEYNSKMGSLSKKDIFYYLQVFQKTLFDLNQTYLQKEYKNLNKTISKYIDKINITYLSKLKRSFEMTLLKFATILTEDSFKKMENNVYKQYYQIESYITSSSEITDLIMDRYLNFLNDTSILFEVMNSLTFMKVLGYYDIVHNSIQNQFQEIKSLNLRTLNTEKSKTSNEAYFKKFFKDIDESLKDLHNHYENKFKENEKRFESTYSNYYNKTYKEIFKESDDYCRYITGKIDDKISNITEKIDKVISNITNNINSFISEAKNKFKNLTIVRKINEVANKIKNKFKSLFPNNGIKIGNFTFIDKAKKFYKNVCKFEYKKEYKFDKEFPLTGLPICPYIQLRLVPYAYLGVYAHNECIKTNNNKNLLEKYDFGLFFDAYVNAKVSIALQVGFYYPGVTSTLEISISVGINGVLGSGKIGIKLDLYLNKGELKTDLYFEFNAFELSFYILFNFRIELKITTITFSFYIFNKVLPGISKTKHKEKTYKLY